jgi:hypothetical protein
MRIIIDAEAVRHSLDDGPNHGKLDAAPDAVLEKALELSIDDAFWGAFDAVMSTAAHHAMSHLGIEEHE